MTPQTTTDEDLSSLLAMRLHCREDCRGSVAGPVTTPCALETSEVPSNLKDWLTEMPHFSAQPTQVRHPARLPSPAGEQHTRSSHEWVRNKTGKDRTPSKAGASPFQWSVFPPTPAPVWFPTSRHCNKCKSDRYSLGCLRHTTARIFAEMLIA